MQDKRQTTKPVKRRSMTSLPTTAIGQQVIGVGSGPTVVSCRAPRHDWAPIGFGTFADRRAAQTGTGNGVASHPEWNGTGWPGRDAAYPAPKPDTTGNAQSRNRVRNRASERARPELEKHRGVVGRREGGRKGGGD